MITGYLLGIALLSGGWNMTQEMVDNNIGVEAFDVQSGCGGTSYVIGHNYLELGKRISKIKKGQVITYRGCSYKILGVEKRKRSEYDRWRFIPGMLHIQTCIGDSTENILFIYAKPIVKYNQNNLLKIEKK